MSNCLRLKSTAGLSMRRLGIRMAVRVVLKSGTKSRVPSTITIEKSKRPVYSSVPSSS